jgi:sialate O-acetylesterase
MSRDALDNSKEFKNAVSKTFGEVKSKDKNGEVGPNDYPALLYNGMINPLVPYGIRGALWYQGEANAGRAHQYSISFPLLISNWRKKWNQGDFPFYFVQLSSWMADHGNSNKGSKWAELRESQTATLSVPNTGMAVTLDIGDTKDIHPANKQDVGLRLAAIALNKDYGRKNEYSGPVYKDMKVEGNKVHLTFDHAKNGFLIKDAYGYLKGFEVAGSDQHFYYAKAAITDGRVVVYSDSVVTPVAVRYGWADDMPEANLNNREGLPAVPFRTDNWKRITADVRYSVK